MYGGRSRIYTLQLRICLIYFSLTEFPRRRKWAFKYGYICQRRHIYIYSYILGLYFVSYWICLLSISFKYGKILWPITGLNCGAESHTYLNIDQTWNYFFEFQIWDMDFQPAYNWCKLTIWLLWCSNLILYKPLSWTSLNLDSRQYTNTYSERNLHLFPSPCWNQTGLK